MSSPIDELHEWNRKMVDEFFRVNGGKPAGPLRNCLTWVFAF